MNRAFEYVISKHQKHAGKAALPQRKTEYSAGYDICLPFDLHLKPTEGKLCFTDIKCKMPKDEYLMIVIRSSLGIKKLSLMNSMGIIDSDYYNNNNNDGNIGLPLINNSRQDIKITAGEPIAQGIFMKYIITDNDDVKALRTGGFGSTKE